MKRIETLTDKFKERDRFDSRTYGVLQFSVASRAKVTHLAEDVLPKYTSSRPNKMFMGELEALVLEPILQLVKRILTTSGGYKAGDMAVYFMTESKKYAALADILQQTSSKPMFEALAEELIQHSPLFSAISVLKKGATAKDTYSELLRSLAKWTQSDADKSDDARKALNSVITSTTTVSLKDDMQSALYRLNLYGGYGSGVPLPPNQKRMRVQDLDLVEFAIAALANPNYYGVSHLDQGNDAYLDDAYALAMLYISYLYHTQDEDHYQTAAPTGNAGSDFRLKMPQILVTSRKMAWLYAGVAEAPYAFNLSMIREWLKGTLDFLEPCLDTDFNDFDDLKKQFIHGETALMSSIPSPVAHHVDHIFSTLKYVTAVDVLLPPVLEGVLQYDSVVSTPTAPTSMPIGFSGVETDTFKTHVLLNDVIRMEYATLKDRVSRFRSEAEAYNVKVNSFLGSQEFDPNSMNIPNETFTVTSTVYPLHMTTYRSPYERELFPVSLRKFVFVDDPAISMSNVDGKVSPTSNQPKWILQEHTYQIMNMASLFMGKMRVSKPHFIFGTAAAVPAESTLITKFSSIPIPYPYTRFAESESTANDIMTVSAVMRHSTSGITGAMNYFSDISALLDSPSQSVRQGITAALAGLFVMERKSRDGNWKTIYPSPSVPTIYGIGAKLFIDVNLKCIEQFKADKSKYYPGQHVENLNERTSYRFTPIVVVPPPGDLISLTAEVDESAFLKTVVLADLYSAKIGMAMAAFASDIGEDSSQRTTDKRSLYEAIAIANDSASGLMAKNEWLMVTAWSRTFQHFPHIAFDVQPTLTDRYHLTDRDIDNFRHKRVRRRRLAKSRSMEIMVELDRPYFLIEPTDINTLQDPPPREIGRQPVVPDDAQSNTANPTDSGATPHKETGPKPTDPKDTSGRHKDEKEQAAGSVKKESTAPHKIKADEVKDLENKPVEVPKDIDPKGNPAEPNPPTTMGEPKEEEDKDGKPKDEGAD